MKSKREPFVAKNAWWYAHCEKHGETEHLGVLNGACVECQKETDSRNENRLKKP